MFKREEIEENGRKIPKLVLNRQLIREFSSHLNFRDQVIHLCIMSSGLDSNDLLKLTVGDIRSQEGHSRIYLNNTRNKTFMEYKDFFSIEATSRLRAYMKKERADALDDEPLFVTGFKGRKTAFRKKEGRSYRLGDILPKGTRLKSSELSDNFRDAQRIMKISLGKGKQSPLRPKRWRKVFKTAASNSNLDRDIIKIFLGQSGDSSQSYEEDDRNTMEFHYEMLEPKILLFQDENFDNKEVVKLQNDLREAEKKISTLENLKAELRQEFRAEIRNLTASK